MLGFHAAAEGFDTAKDKPGIERGAGESEGVTDPGDAFGCFGGCRDDAAPDDVGVAVDVFGGGVDNDIDAEFQRSLKVGREECIVAD